MSNKQNKLNWDEQVLEEELARGEWVSDVSQGNKKMWAEAVATFEELAMTKRVTMRINVSDLVKVKARAKKARMPYQTLLKVLIKRFAEGQVAVGI